MKIRWIVRAIFKTNYSNLRVAIGVKNVPSNQEYEH